MKMEEQQMLADGLAFALDAHGGQKRKGKQVPYVSHLMQVAGLIFEHGGDADQATAGLLHDIVEDTSVSIEDVGRRVNEGVAAIVKVCTDTLPGDTPEKKSGWKERKLQYLANLEAAEARALLVVACDKLHNLGNIVADLRATGPEFLDRFTAKPQQTLWYYESVRGVLHGRVPDSLVAEIDLHIESLREFVS